MLVKLCVAAAVSFVLAAPAFSAPTPAVTLAAPASQAQASKTAPSAADCRQETLDSGVVDEPGVIAACGQIIGDKAASPKTIAAAYVVRGRVLYSQDKNAVALKDVEAALGLDPENVDALMIRASIRDEASQPGPALADFDAAVRLAPKASRPLIARAYHGHSVVHDEAKARRDISAAIAIADGDLALAYWRLAQLESAQAHYDLALKAFDLALASKPPNLVVLQRERAAVLEALGRDDEALKIYSDILAANPDASVTFTYRSSLLERRGDHAGSARDCAAAIKLRPAVARPHYLCAVAHVALDKLDLALADINEALRLDPGSLDDLIERGLIHRARREPDLASMTGAWPSPTRRITPAPWRISDWRPAWTPRIPMRRSRSAISPTCSAGRKTPWRAMRRP